jgi:hypothetical protein
MTRTGTKFGRKMEDAVVALLTQRNLEEAAKSVGISTRTMLRWMKEPEFKEAFRKAKRASYDQAVSRLQQAMPLAVQAMLKVLLDPNTPASVRVRAAEVIANHSHKAIEIEDVESRVAALEEAAGEQGRIEMRGRR